MRTLAQAITELLENEPLLFTDLMAGEFIADLAVEFNTEWHLVQDVVNQVEAKMASKKEKYGANDE